MIRTMRLTPTRGLALVALGIPAALLALLILSNVSATQQWPMVTFLVGALAVVILVGAVLFCCNQIANRTADRIGSHRTVWTTYGAAVSAAWSMGAALVCAGAQFRITDSGSVGGFAAGATAFALLSVAALTTATVTGVVALVQASARQSNPGNA